ncbi:MAG: Maf family protein [Defluviitaleaceae bacterium]|nr:Maf family protein [Defluviitaleaceae bacterium]
MRIILASASPRRRQLMAQLGINCEIIESNADETASGPADKQVEELAVRKAQAVRRQIDGEAIIIAADTLVAIDGQILAKPTDAAEAFAMLKTLQGRQHTVYTGVALIKTDKEDHLHSFVEAADVFFRPLTDWEIEGYIATGEPFDKAGAYGVQDIGAALVARVEGDYYTVVGLPLSRLVVALDNMGVDIWGKMRPT